MDLLCTGGGGGEALGRGSCRALLELRAELRTELRAELPQSFVQSFVQSHVQACRRVDVQTCRCADARDVCRDDCMGNCLDVRTGIRVGD